MNVGRQEYKYKHKALQKEGQIAGLEIKTQTLIFAIKLMSKTFGNIP